MEYALFYAEGDDALPYSPEADDIGAWQDAMAARGAAEYGERLRPDHDATTVRRRGGRLLVTDGPFTESKESIGGFDVIDAPDLDAAVEIAAAHPVAKFGRVEVRPFVQWPDNDETYRVVPAGFAERPACGQRYLLLVVAGDGEIEDGPDESDPEQWVRETTERGVRLFGDVLQPPETATFVRSRGGATVLADGAFSEAKEWIAGFDLIEVTGLAEAVEVAAAHPMSRLGTIELRPLWPFDTHGDLVALVAREAAEAAQRVEPRAATLAVAGAS